jgi:hypothetical protein
VKFGRFPRYKKAMDRIRCYQPAISRALVAALYHEAKVRRVPMTRLIDRLLRESLRGSCGWRLASRDWPELKVLADVGQHGQ